MANGHPQFGDLDIGQRGGTRQVAAPSEALFSCNVIVGADEIATVEQGLVQQQRVFQDNLGYRGTPVSWVNGLIRANTKEIMAAIINELNERRTGSLRDGQGVMLAADPTKFAEAQLTNSDGTVLTQRAVFQGWRQSDRRMASAEWAVIMPVTIVFRMLG